VNRHYIAIVAAQLSLASRQMQHTTVVFGGFGRRSSPPDAGTVPQSLSGKLL